MSGILSLLSGGWNYVLAGLVLVAALITAWFGGKKIGSVQTQAKADVQAAQKDAQQAQQETKRESANIQAAKNAQQVNNSLSDSAVRDRMRSGKYHTDD